ncbi:hypothetical protein CTheo_8658 [Ceratobasidium theobromae]|uniref:DNA 3'-5' helicase n=1 Tax=Ceratobasidium theobromae TaxID=1582974 RepID=A0A5N5Q801_9AGAM|nr:hypothetical protein CTheo_8658 [Ceratobasidium theobromae]
MVNLHDILTPALRERYKDLGETMCRHFGWEKAHQFQIDGTMLQLAGYDGIVHVATGRGKTAIVAGPYVYEENLRKTTIMVCPLIALQEEMKVTFERKHGLSAIIINSGIGNGSTEILKEVVNNKYWIILISPESLLSRRIIDVILRNSTFTKSVLSLVIDEAHCVSFWSNSFRKKYGALHLVRQFLPRRTPVIALSATLTPRVRRDLVPKLNLSTDHVLINEGNHKPNLTIAVLRCKYTLKSLHDLAFVIPDSTFHPFDIPKTLVYTDNIDTGRQIVQFLTSLLPDHLRNAGIIRPYNSRHTQEYRALAMQQLREDNIRVLVCTDAAGMGCDIPDIDVVVQWRITFLSALIQCWGRAGRGPGRTGLGILLFEPSACKVDPTSPGESNRVAKSKPGNKRQQRSALRKGGFQSDAPGAEPEVHDDSPAEGTYAMVQTNGCVRHIWTKVFDNQPIG